MAKREYSNITGTTPIPQPEAEAPVRKAPQEPSKKHAPVKKTAQPTKAEPAATGGAQPPRKGTPREDATPSRFDALRAAGLGFVNGVVDAFDEAFARLDAHEERLDEHDRQLRAVEGRLTTLEGRPAPQPTRQEGVTITIKVDGGNVRLE